MDGFVPESKFKSLEEAFLNLQKKRKEDIKKLEKTIANQRRMLSYYKKKNPEVHEQLKFNFSYTEQEGNEEEWSV